MGIFDMVVLIVAIVAIAGIFKARYANFEPARRDGDPAVRAENEALRTELRALKDRVAILERIATDSSTALDREIEKLRRD